VGSPFTTTEETASTRLSIPPCGQHSQPDAKCSTKKSRSEKEKKSAEVTRDKQKYPSKMFVDIFML
jgi:hypothetical protein